jgi:hypothetical protein
MYTVMNLLGHMELLILECSVTSFCTVFSNICTNLPSNQQCVRGPYTGTFSPGFVLFFCLFTNANLTGMRWCLIEVLTYISLMINNITHVVIPQMVDQLIERKWEYDNSDFFNRLIHWCIYNLIAFFERWCELLVVGLVEWSRSLGVWLWKAPCPCPI